MTEQKNVPEFPEPYSFASGIIIQEKESYGNGKYAKNAII